MEININLWAWLSLIGSAQGIFLALVLFFHKSAVRRASWPLALLILLFSLRLAEFAGYWTSFFAYLPHLLFATVSFQFLFGVLLYWYGRGIADQTFSLNRRELLHLTPFVVHLASLVPFYLLGAGEKLTVLNAMIFTTEPVFSNEFFVTEGLQNIHMMAYIVLTLHHIRKNLTRPAYPLKADAAVRLRWVQKLSLGFGIFVLIDIVHLAELIFFGYKFIVEIDSIILLSSSVLIFIMGFVAVREPRVFSVPESGRNGGKYERSGLTAERADAIMKELHQAMEDGLSRNRQLGLRDLAQRMKVSPNHLSQILNEQLHQNFFDFVNRYRIEDAKRLLTGPEGRRYTIQSIALEVGFNTKASFNAAFRKHTGTTPSQYRKKSDGSV
ncbi:MAG: helix-turn-helix domain-containing protein [Ignavibacteria bacterium]|nr:helix-turn-helix domain-containing protein [Ignavibacteria bacterium]